MAADGVLQVNDSNFDTEVLKSELPVLVDFWAPWCGPCRMISPIIDQIAQESGGKYRVAKVNTDEAQETSVKYNVTSIPALLIFKGGEPAWRHVGVTAKPSIQAALAQVVA